MILLGEPLSAAGKRFNNARTVVERNILMTLQGCMTRIPKESSKSHRTPSNMPVAASHRISISSKVGKHIYRVYSNPCLRPASLRNRSHPSNACESGQRHSVWYRAVEHLPATTAAAHITEFDNLQFRLRQTADIMQQVEVFSGGPS